MAPGKKGTSKRREHTARDKAAVADANPVAGAAQKDKEPPGAGWTTFLLFLATAVILAFVFLPWCDRYIQGQFFGLSGRFFLASFSTLILVILVAETTHQATTLPADFTGIQG